VYDQIQEYTCGRRLRLHVVLGGYSSYEEAPEDGEGVSGKQLKTVHVHEETIRVIIHKGTVMRSFEENFNNRLSKLSCRSNLPLARQERKNSVCDYVALPSELGFVPHQLPRWQERCAQQPGRSFDGA
jgi:hypothetical protein